VGFGIDTEKNAELQSTCSTYLRVKRHFFPLAPRVSTKIMNYQSTIASLYTTVVLSFMEEFVPIMPGLKGFQHNLGTFIASEKPVNPEVCSMCFW